MLSASIIKNKKNLYLRISILEGSRDTEDCNDAENDAENDHRIFFSKQLFNFFNFF